jgi:hypothetical protein
VLLVALTRGPRDAKISKQKWVVGHSYRRTYIK